MPDNQPDDQPDDREPVDPEDFLRALLRIAPEDAAKVREDAAREMRREDEKRVSDADSPDS